MFLGVLSITFGGLPDEWILVFLSLPLPTPLLPTPYSLLESGQGLMLLAALSMAVGTVMIRFVSLR